MGNSEKRIPASQLHYYVTLTKASEVTGLSSCYIRSGVKANTIPHIKCGNRYMVNLPMFLENLRKECEHEA